MSRALAVAVLLVVAGCSLPANGPAPDTATVTPAPVPEPTATVMPPGAFAPGVTDDGVSDPNRLARAHARVLEANNYTVNQTIVRRYRNGTLRSRYVTVARFATRQGVFTGTSVWVDRRDGGLVERRVERYGDGTVSYEAVTTANGTDYRRSRTPDGTLRDPSRVYPGNLTNTRSVARVFTLVPTRQVGAFAANGTEYVLIENATAAPVPPLANVSVVAVVSERGLVRSYRVSYDFVTDGQRVETLVSVSYTRVGSTTVERPAWVDRVEATATPR